MSFRNIIELIKKTFSEWSEDHASRLAAALSYYTTFSLAPLFVIVIAVAGLVGAQEAAQSQIMAQVQELFGAQGREFIESMIANVNVNRSTSITATILGIVTVLFAALAAFAQLQDALNTIWGVKPKPAGGIAGSIKSFFMKRVLSFGLVLGIGFLLLVSLVISAALSGLEEYIADILPVPVIVLQILNFLVPFGIITILFAMIFKILPDVEISWKDVWLGAAVTSLLFTLGQLALGYYLGSTDVGSAFGAAGSLVVIMVWIYYSAQILFLGAEFTQVYANQFGSGIVPEEDAVRIDRKQPEEQAEPQRETFATAARVRQAALTRPAGHDHPRRKSSWSKALFYLLLVTQFIPSIRRLYASKAEPTSTTTPSSNTGPATRFRVRNEAET